MSLFELVNCMRSVRLYWRSPVHLTGYSPVVRSFNLKRVSIFSDSPTNTVRVTEAGRVDFNKAILPEVGWDTELDDIKVKAE